MSAAPVLYVIDSLGLSGKSKAMVDLIAGLDPARYTAHVVYFKPEESVLEGRLRSLGVEPQEVPCPDGLNARIVARLGAGGAAAAPGGHPLLQSARDAVWRTDGAPPAAFRARWAR